MNVLVVWRRLSVGGISTGWRNRANYFVNAHIATDFLFTMDNGGRQLFGENRRIYITNKNEEIMKIVMNYDVIVIIDYRELFELIKQSSFSGKIILESRVPLKYYVHRQYHRNISGASCFVVPSHFQKKLVSSALTAPIPIHVIYNSVDTDVFQPIEKKEMSLTPLLAKNKKLVAWIGNLSNRQKNWKFLLNVISNIVSERDDLHFLIIGGRTSREKERFLATITELQLQSYLDWLPHVPYEQLPYVYNNVAHSGGCLFSTSSFESFGNIFIEAMACKCPIVAPNNSAISELIVDGENGKLYKTKNVTHAVRVLYETLDTPPLKKNIAEKGYLDVLNTFSSEKSAQKYIELLRAIST